MGTGALAMGLGSGAESAGDAGGGAMGRGGRCSGEIHCDWRPDGFRRGTVTVTATGAAGGAWRRGVTATGGGDERMGCRRAGGTTRPVEEWGTETGREGERCAA